MKKVIHDLSLGFRMAFYARSIKQDFVFHLIAFGLGFAMLTGAAITQNTFDNGYLMCYGTWALTLGGIGILSDYNAVLYSEFLLTSPKSRQLQIGLHLEMSLVLSIVCYTLVAIVELLFARDSGGDVLLFVSVLFALMVILTGGSRKSYVWTILSLLLPMMMVFASGIGYFYMGIAEQGFNPWHCLLWGTKALSFFRKRKWAAMALGYLILLAAGGIQYLELRFWWKKDGGKLFYAMKKTIR